MRPLHLFCLAAAFISAAPCFIAAADRVPPTPEFRAAKRIFQQKIRSRKPADRVAAVKQLAEFPTVDAVDLILTAKIPDPSADVSKEIREVLAGFGSHAEIGQHLLDHLTRETRKSGMSDEAYHLLWVAARFESDEVRQGVVQYLDEFLGTPKAKQIIIHNLIDDLGKRRDGQSMEILKLFSKARYFGINFGYRRCIVQAMTQFQPDDSFEFLIDLIPVTHGLVQHDVIQHLTDLTHQHFADDAEKWRAWWATQKGKFTGAAGGVPVNRDIVGARYYGIPISAKRLAFVLDTSGSMRGPKLDAAKNELLQALQALPKEVNFSVVIFNSTVRVWQTSMVPATPEWKQRAANLIAELEATRDTASYDALEAAFALDPEAIFFVSDGAPTSGKVVSQADIVNVISTLNRVRRVSIHTVGIGTNDTTAAIFGRFMRSLAEPNWGEYRNVER